MNLRVHSTLARSRANGPGERFVVWVQGCTLGCPGCSNRGACSTEGGRDVAVEELADEVAVTDAIEGLTLSGGEPFQQAGPAADLCRRVKANGLSVFVFTGYTLEQVQNSPDPVAHDLLAQTDVLVAGPFIQQRRTSSLWRGSDNQTVHFLTQRYAAADFDLDGQIDEVEIVVDDAGNIVVTGFPDDDVLDALRG